MNAINFKHLRYFWMVARTGSIARASEQLHITPQSISGQLSEFEEKLGVKLFRPVGRNRELTDEGRRILSYAEEIFRVGDELLEVLRGQELKRTLSFRVGVVDALSKLMAYRLLEPALKIDEELRLVCREGRLSSLLAELAIHRLDMIIADRPMPSHLNVRCFSHLLGESGLTVFGTQALVRESRGEFPALLDRAPFLLPGEDATVRPKLLQWFDDNEVRPRIAGEFDDSALMKAFGQAGVGFFVAPRAVTDDVCEQYQVVVVGRIDTVVEKLYGITTERRPTHPAIVACSRAARGDVFSEALASGHRRAL